MYIYISNLWNFAIPTFSQPPASTESVANLPPVSSESVANLPATWRQPGCCRFEYNYPACQDVSCSITVMSAGTSLIVHGKVIVLKFRKFFTF